MKNPNLWFCGVEGQQFGPFTWEQMRGMAAEGRIVSESFVRRDVDPQWFHASQVPGLLPKSHPASSSSIHGKRTVGVKAAGKSIAGKAAKRGTTAGASRTKPSDSTSVADSVEDAMRAAKVKPSDVRDPSGAPKGVPVGRPESPPPIGVPVSPPPVGVPVNAATPFVLQTAPQAVTATQPGTEPAMPPQKSSNGVILVAALGAVAAVVGAVGVGLVAWNSMRSARPANEQLAESIESQLKASLEEVAAELEGNPPGTDVDSSAAAELQAVADEMAKGLASAVSKGELATSGEVAQSTPASTAAAAKLVTSIPNWTSVVNLRGIALNNLRLQVASAWLAADETGARVEPAADGQAAAAAKYVFVEVRITNTAPVPRKYKSWNVASGTSAVLADQANHVFAIVPPATTPAAKRLTEVSIAPGEAVTDQLVFAAPQTSIEQLKLALAKSAFAEGAKFKSGSHFALEIPREVLLTKKASSPVVTGDAAVQANQVETPTDIGPAIIAAPATVAEAGEKPPEVARSGPPAMKQGAKPPSVEELNRQFEELSKESGQDKEMAKKGAAQK